MELPKVEAKSFLIKLKHLILGKEKPNLLTRISCGVGFLVWVYLISWPLITLVAMLLGPTLTTWGSVSSRIHTIGTQYGFGGLDTVGILKLHSLIQIGLYFFMLIGLILIYRKKKLGFLLYSIPAALTFIVTFAMMGTEYMVNEISYVDASLLVISAAYFGIGALIFYKKKADPQAA